AMPVAFVTAMICGIGLGVARVPLPFAETGIALSMLVLGALIASCARTPLALGMLIAGAFAICHGHSHGTEIPASALGLSYGAGLVLATAALHLAGVASVLALRRLAPRASTVTLASAGVALAVVGACWSLV